MNTCLQFTHSYLQGPVKVEQKSNEEADSLYSVPLPISPWVSEPMPQACYRPSVHCHRDPLRSLAEEWPLRAAKPPRHRWAHSQCLLGVLNVWGPE